MSRSRSSMWRAFLRTAKRPVEGVPVAFATFVYSVVAACNLFALAVLMASWSAPGGVDATALFWACAIAAVTCFGETVKAVIRLVARSRR